MTQRIYVIHGYYSNSCSHWFPWLKETFSTETVEVVLLDMPSPFEPIKEEWLSYLEKNISVLNENTIFVCHSLGCIATLMYLQKKKQKIKGTILVSGFVEESPIPELSGFMTEELDYALLKDLIPNRVSITAKDDDIVPREYTVEMSKKLDTELFVLEKGKHFLDRDGYYKLPVVSDVIKTLL